MRNLRNYVKKNKGITLVSLVVTIIVLIILAGVSINLTLGENGIITVAKKAKENIELAKVEEETRLNELYTQIEAEGGVSGEISYDAIAKLSEFKKAIADAIEEAGGVKPEYTANSTTFGESIKGIVKEVTKDATATAEDIVEGKTAYVNGELLTGIGTNKNLAFTITVKTTATVQSNSNNFVPSGGTISITNAYRYENGKLNFSSVSNSSNFSPDSVSNYGSFRVNTTINSVSITFD